MQYMIEQILLGGGGGGNNGTLLKEVGGYTILQGIEGFGIERNKPPKQTSPYIHTYILFV